MNRLQLDVATHPPCQRHDKQDLTSSLERVPHHRFFIPLHYEKNYAYPLLVWLHGPTGCELEINQVMPHISMRNHVGVSPRGVVKHSATHPNGDSTFTWDQSPQSIEFALEDVLQCVAEARRRFNISRDRIFLAGTGTGGTMALRLAMAAPQHFAGVATIGGAMPCTDQPLAGIERARRLPVMIGFGAESEIYSANQACHDLRLLHAAGLAVTLCQYPCGQEVTTKMLADLNAWIMEQVVGTRSHVFAYDDPTRQRIHDHN